MRKRLFYSLFMVGISPVIIVGVFPILFLFGCFSSFNEFHINHCIKKNYLFVWK